MIPLLIVRTLNVQEGIVTIAFCHENWPGSSSRKIYDIILFVFIYVIPGSVVVVSYSATGCHLMTATRNLTRTNSEVTQSYKVMAGRRRVAKMLLVLAILFALSWLPYYTIMLYTDFNNTKDASLTGLSFALLLGHSHSAQNPVIYCFMNSSFKTGMLTLLKCKWSAHPVLRIPLSVSTSISLNIKPIYLTLKVITFIDKAVLNNSLDFTIFMEILIYREQLDILSMLFPLLQTSGFVTQDI